MLNINYKKLIKMKKSGFILAIYLTIFIVCLVGEIKCVIKMINCNWEPVGKAEILYTVSVFTGVGSIVGYIDIKDN